MGSLRVQQPSTHSQRVELLVELLRVEEWLLLPMAIFSDVAEREADTVRTVCRKKK